MLILSRKVNQAVILGGEVEILVTEIKGDTVKLGIRAPADIAVHRKEIHEVISRKNLEASGARPEDLDNLPSLS